MTSAVPIQGVNLGGWLVLEKWITPSVFKGLSAQDEYSFHREQKDQNAIHQHWQTFITKDDLEWIRDQGLNAVRVPVGYWLFGDVSPFPASIQHLDWLMEVSKELGLHVLIDLHGVPGSQNGWDHSGRSGKIQWMGALKNVKVTHEILLKILKRYTDYPNLWGIELVNEPHPTINFNKLTNFYNEAYQNMREINSDIAIVIHDSFRTNRTAKWLRQEQFHNVYLDIHHYQVFHLLDKLRKPQQHFKKIQRLQGEFEKLQESTPIIVGEWSAALDPMSLKGFSEHERAEVYREYFQLQKQVYSHTSGWFYWTYKTETMGTWGYRYYSANSKV